MRLRSIEDCSNISPGSVHAAVMPWRHAKLYVQPRLVTVPYSSQPKEASLRSGTEARGRQSARRSKAKSGGGGASWRGVPTSYAAAVSSTGRPSDSDRISLPSSAKLYLAYRLLIASQRDLPTVQKLKALVFIPVVAFVHFCCWLAVLIDRLGRYDCNMGLPTCVTPTGRVVDAILAFPLGDLSTLLGLNRFLPNLSLGLVMLNSLSAATFVWLVVWVFMRSAAKRAK
jgi:hypothetical protein